MLHIWHMVSSTHGFIRKMVCTIYVQLNWRLDLNLPQYRVELGPHLTVFSPTRKLDIYIQIDRLLLFHVRVTFYHTTTTIKIVLLLSAHCANNPPPLQTLTAGGI